MELLNIKTGGTYSDHCALRVKHWEHCINNLLYRWVILWSGLKHTLCQPREETIAVVSSELRTQQHDRGQSSRKISFLVLLREDGRAWMSRLVSGAVFGAFATKCYEHAPFLFVRLLHARIRAPLIEFSWTLQRRALYRGTVFRFPQREDICLFERFHTGSGAYRASYLMGTVRNSPGAKRPGRQAAQETKNIHR